MSDISPKGGTVQDSAEIYRLLRERFAPMARFGGPLYAGVYEHEGISGTMYVGELNQWLWVPWPEPPGSLRPEDALLSDAQVAAARDLAAVSGTPEARSAQSHFHEPDPDLSDRQRSSSGRRGGVAR